VNWAAHFNGGAGPNPGVLRHDRMLGMIVEKTVEKKGR
jgi:hypothetical protein